MADTVKVQSIDDQYMAKMKKKRIITNSIILSLCLILAFVIILLACLRIDLKPRFDNNPEYVDITVDGKTDVISFSKGDERYDEFMAIYNSALSTSILSSIFTGNVYGYDIEYVGTGASDTSERFYESYSNGSGYGISSALSSRLGSNYVHFRFTEDQSIYHSNGTVLDGRYSDNAIFYKDVYFTISSDENSTEVTYYFGVMDYGNYPTMVKITVEAQSYSLYDYAMEL